MQLLFCVVVIMLRQTYNTPIVSQLLLEGEKKMNYGLCTSDILSLACTQVHGFFSQPNLWWQQIIILESTRPIDYSVSESDNRVGSTPSISTLCVRDFNFLKLYLFVFHNTDTFYLFPRLLVFTLSVIINTHKSKSPVQPVYTSRVDPSASSLAFSLSSHRYSYTGLQLSSRCVD